MMRLSFFPVFHFLDLDKEEKRMYSGECNFHISRHSGGGKEEYI